MKRQRLEYCCYCGEATGRAGRGDDSIYCECGDGPLCELCWGDHRNICKQAIEEDSDREMSEDVGEK